MMHPPDSEFAPDPLSDGDAPASRDNGEELLDQEPITAEQIAAGPADADQGAAIQGAANLATANLATANQGSANQGSAGAVWAPADTCASDGREPGSVGNAATGSPTGSWPFQGEARTRWWSPLAVAGLSLGVFVVASAVMAVIALFVVNGKISPEVLRDSDPMQRVSQSRLGLFLVVVPPQIALVTPCILAAFFSPVSFRERLGLVRGNWPVWTWVAVAAATPLVGMVSGLVVGLFLEESDALKELTEIFRGHGKSGFLFPLAMMIGATPAICEELLFRGYIQTRLTRSLGPILGVGIASFLFAAFHLDVVHVVAVFPLGLFLGWVSWQSGSLFPAMAGHFVNNVISVVAIVVSPEENPDVLALPAVAFTVAIFGLGILGMAVVSVVSIAYRRADSDDLSAAEAQLA